MFPRCGVIVIPRSNRFRIIVNHKAPAQGAGIGEALGLRLSPVMRNPIGSLANRFRNHPGSKQLAVVILIGAAMRVLWLGLPPNIYGDSGSYLWLASNIRILWLRGFYGDRTPVYSLFILLSGLNVYVVRDLQNLLGVVIAVILFAMVYRSTCSRGAALAAGLAYAVDLSQLSFEQDILTETVCTFMLMLSALTFQRMVLEGRSGRLECAALGTFAGLTGLTRPLYAYLTPLYFGFLAVMIAREPAESGGRSGRLVLFAAPACALLLGWCTLNWMNGGDFTLTSRAGLGLTNLSGAFIELAPDKYASIRDPYLRARSKQIAKRGDQAMTIFAVLPELRAQPKYQGTRLSRELIRMSIELFAAHPVLYAQWAARSWMRFWRPPMYLLARFSGRAEGALEAFWSVEDQVLRAVNLLFILFAILMLAQVVLRTEAAGVDMCAALIVLALK